MKNLKSLIVTLCFLGGLYSAFQFLNRHVDHGLDEIPQVINNVAEQEKRRKSEPIEAFIEIDDKPSPMDPRMSEHVLGVWEFTLERGAVTNPDVYSEYRLVMKFRENGTCSLRGKNPADGIRAEGRYEVRSNSLLTEFHSIKPAHLKSAIRLKCNGGFMNFGPEHFTIVDYDALTVFQR